MACNPSFHSIQISQYSVIPKEMRGFHWNLKSRLYVASTLADKSVTCYKTPPPCEGFHCIMPDVPITPGTHFTMAASAHKANLNEIHLALNSLRPRQNGHHFAGQISSAFSWMKMLEFWLKFSLKFVSKGPINNIPALVQIMAWRQPGDKPLSKPMMVSLPSPGLNELMEK